MDSAFKRLIRRLSPTERNRYAEKIFVGAFGKHPGWDDHIDDIGLETDVLIAAKRKLYVQGIGGNVDSGRWDGLTDGHFAEGFNREIFWHTNGHLTVGRMWPSRDGIGRRSYPLIVCIECWKLPTQWILQFVLPRLDKIQGACVATDSADDVRLSFEEARRELRQLAQECESPAGSTIVYPDALVRLAGRQGMGLVREGLFRILYHVDREVGRLNCGAPKRRIAGSTLLRLPTTPDTIFEDVFLWSSFLLAEFGITTSILALVPAPENKWIDMIVGEPTELQLYCLKASTKIIPLTSNIPYNVSSEFVNRVRRLINDGHSYKSGP